MLTVLEAWSEIRVPALSGESPLLCSRVFASSHVRGGKGALWNLFYEGSNLIMRVLPLGPNYLPKFLPSNSITSGVKIATSEFWRDTNIHTRTMILWSPGACVNKYYLINSFCFLILYSPFPVSSGEWAKGTCKRHESSLNKRFLLRWYFWV